MIVHPRNWSELGVPIVMGDIDEALREVVKDINCINLSFSGGIDSSLLLYYLLEVKGTARCFTIANDAEHPDIEYSAKAIRWFEERYKVRIDHMTFVRPRLEGNDLVKAFYGALKPSVSCIIAGDCIDELSCGYYAHQDMTEETYQDYLKRLQREHLRPLNQNSGGIAVYLPYADDRVTSLLYQIPLYEKVNAGRRKIVIMELAEGRVPPESIDRKKYGFGTSAVKAKV